MKVAIFYIHCFKSLRVHVLCIILEGQTNKKLTKDRRILFMKGLRPFIIYVLKVVLYSGWKHVED